MHNWLIAIKSKFSCKLSISKTIAVIEILALTRIILRAVIGSVIVRKLLSSSLELDYQIRLCVEYR